MNKRILISIIAGAAILLWLNGCLSPKVDSKPKAEAFAGHEKLAQLQGPFDSPHKVTEACINCHEQEANDFMQTTHWTWTGPSTYMKGHENEVHNGKVNGINNFCVAIESNWGRCAQCHAGYGWKDNTFDFKDPKNIDCLSCHDGSGTYKKDPKTAGMPAAGVDLARVAKSVSNPTRKACGSCHFFAGGGDNVKKGDLYTDFAEPDETLDVHMGGLDFSCQECHSGSNHEIKGSSLHIGVANERVQCTDCHDLDVHEKELLNKHSSAIACQTCHIPTFSRARATKVFWDWSKAGAKDANGKEITKKDADGNLTYISKKGEFVWEKNVKPTYAWWNGNFNRMLLGDSYSETPVDLGSPIGSIDDKEAKIFPFKVMRGIQGADPVNKTILVPHLFGKEGGKNPYWKKWSWDLAFKEGMEIAGLEYSGKYDWVETFMYMGINHEVAPASEALSCNDCHNGGMDFKALGYKGDPKKVGGR